MIKKIAIVHKSEIFRKGLNVIIKSLFNPDIYQFAQIKELKEQPEIQSSMQILFIENDGINDPSFFNQLKSLKPGTCLYVRTVLVQTVSSGTLKAVLTLKMSLKMR